MKPRTRMLLLLGVGAVGVFGIGWYLTSSSGSSSGASSTGAQNAVNPNAQVGAGAYAQGTMPDLGNLLWENQPAGSVLSAPQATSVSTGVAGDYPLFSSTIPGAGGTWFGSQPLILSSIGAQGQTVTAST